MASEPMMSASTCPGPTEGSWSMSPTISSAAASGVAFISACISMHVDHRGLVDDQQVAVEGLSSLRLNPPPLGSTSSSRWIVFASMPVASVMRLAARPVGAQSSILTPLAARISQDRVDDRRLADAGAAGDDQRLALSARPIASFCVAASCKPVRLSTQAIAFVRVDVRPGQRAAGDPVSRSAMACSAR